MSKRFFYYDGNGEIRGEAIADDCLPTPYPVLEVGFDAVLENSYVTNQEIQTYTQAQLVLKAARPSPDCTWSNASMSWVDPRSLAQVQADQCDLIDIAYAAAIQTSVTFTTAAGTTQTFQADTESQTVLMQSAVGYGFAGATPPGFFWKAQDNTLVTPFTLADLHGLYGAMLSQGQVAFAHKAALKAQINACTDAASVLAITW